MYVDDRMCVLETLISGELHVCDEGRCLVVVLEEACCPASHCHGVTVVEAAAGSCQLPPMWAGVNAALLQEAVETTNLLFVCSTCKIIQMRLTG